MHDLHAFVCSRVPAPVLPPEDTVCLTWAVTEVACNAESVSDWIIASSGAHWLTVTSTAVPVTCDALMCFLFFFWSRWKWMCPEQHLLLRLRGRWRVDEQKGRALEQKHRKSIKPTHEAGLKREFNQPLCTKNLWDKYICQGCCMKVCASVLPLSIVWPLQLFIRQKAHLFQTHSPNGFGLAEAPLQVWIGFDRTSLSVFFQTDSSFWGMKNGCLRRPLRKPLSSFLQINLIPENKRVTDNVSPTAVWQQL